VCKFGGDRVMFVIEEAILVKSGRDDVINSCHLGFGETGSRPIRSAVPENPTIGSNTKSIGRSVAEIQPVFHLDISWGGISPPPPEMTISPPMETPGKFFQLY